MGTPKLRLDDIDELARALVAKRRAGADISGYAKFIEAQTDFIQKQFRKALNRETFRAINESN